MAERQPATIRPVIAYLWAPYLGVSVARRAMPKLAERPLVLLDEGGCVLAADMPALQAGVSLGLSERQAAARCPEATLLPATRFPLWEAQEQFLDRIKSYTDRWQPDGLGRVYLQAPFTAPSCGPVGVASELVGWCQAAATSVRALGWQPVLGATASKFGANVASQMAWQNAALLLTPAAQYAFLSSQPAATLPLDTDALRQLQHLGIRTLGQYAHLPATGVLTRFGPAGRTAQRWAQGLDERPVTPPWEHPTVAARIEFEAPLADGERLLAALLRQADKLLSPLRDRLQAIGRILLHVTRADGRMLPVTHIFPQPTAAAAPIRLALAGLLAQAPWDGQGATEIALTLAGITDTPGQQLVLFDDTTDDNRARLTATLDRLAARFGADAFRLASLADPDNLLLERRAAFMPWQPSHHLPHPRAAEQARKRVPA